MARYKQVHYEQDKLIPIRFSSQILPGTFDYTLNYLVDNVVDVSVFAERYRNDATGAPANAPALLRSVKSGSILLNPPARFYINHFQKYAEFLCGKPHL